MKRQPWAITLSAFFVLLIRDPALAFNVGAHTQINIEAADRAASVNQHLIVALDYSSGLATVVKNKELREWLGDGGWVVPTDVLQLLESKWIAMKDALRGGNIEGALTFIMKSRRERYRQVFENLTVPLSQIDLVMTDIQFAGFAADSAKFEMQRADQRGTMTYAVYFSLDEDGIWRVSSM